MNLQTKTLIVGVGIGLLAPLAILAWVAPEKPRGETPAAVATPPEAPRVLTPARVQSIFDEDRGARTYVALRLALRPEVPFSTITFRVRDEALLRGVRVGDDVKFAGQHIEGENTLVALEPRAR